MPTMPRLLSRTRNALLAVVTFAGVVQAAEPPAKPAPAPASKEAPGTATGGAQPSQADIAKWTAFFDKLVDTTVADKDNCDKLATDVNGEIDANHDLVAKANAASASGKKLPKEARDHMMGAVGKMMPAMQKCGQNPKVQAAFQRLDMLGHGPHPK